MNEQPMSELLVKTLETYFDVNAMGSEWLEDLQHFLNNSHFPGRSDQFKHGLAMAILHHTITPAQYERLTGADYDTPEDLEVWLRQVWELLYGDEPVTLANVEATATR